MNNKFTTYLLYAIGEIFLVVIGILIAVNIDEWNEQKQAQSLEQEYYCRFLESIEQDDYLIKNVIKLNNDRLASSQKMLSLLNNPRPDKKAVVNAWLMSFALTGRFNPDKSGYEDLTSSGRINFIKNKTLLYQLNNYFQSVEAFAISIETNHQYMIDKFLLHPDPYEFGFLNLDLIISNSDSSLVQDLLSGISPFYTEKQRRQMIDDAIIVNGINNRTAFHLENIQDEIQGMKVVLQNYCETSQEIE